MTNHDQSTNGSNPFAERFKIKLAFPNVTSNSSRRLSLNSAWTFRENNGLSDVGLALFNDSIEASRQRRSKESVDLDALDDRALGTQLQQRLYGIPDLIEPVEDTSRNQQLIRELAARRPTKTVRQVREAAEACVADASAPVRAALRANWQESPFDFPLLADALARSLRDMRFPESDFTPVKQFHNAVRGMDVLSRTTALQPKLRGVLLASMRKRCETAYDAAVSAIAQDNVRDGLRDTIVQFLNYLEELRDAQAAFRRNVDGVRIQLEQERVLARQRSVRSQSSVLLELDTPDQDQLLAGIRDRHHCSDRSELTTLFDERMTVCLTEVARLRYPHVATPATLTDYFAQLPVREIAAAVGDVVAHLLGDIHTVYTAVRAFGVGTVAQELFERAAPLCHLDSRDHVRLNVETHRDLIVRLPRPRGADDAAIAEQLRECFRYLEPTCQFLDDPLEKEITVVRTLVGFPIGIEASNLPMLIDYAHSAEQGHHPHLFGLLPDAPDGKPLSALLSLARYHQQHEEHIR